MGFFSALCEGCSHPLLSLYAVGPGNSGTLTHDNSWMNEAIAILPGGTIASGKYNGYGTVGTVEGAVGLRPSTVWHAACWAVAGSPADYRGNSSDAPDQGYFFEDADHDVARPATQADVDAARACATNRETAPEVDRVPDAASLADTPVAEAVRCLPEHEAGFLALLARVEKTPGLASPTEQAKLRAYLGLPA